MKIDLSQINSELKSREKRTNQSVSRTQIESAKLAKQASKLTAKIGQLAADLKEAKAASAKMSPPKPTTPKPAAKAQTSRKIVVDGKTVTLGPGEEFHSLVRPKEI